MKLWDRCALAADNTTNNFERLQEQQFDVSWMMVYTCLKLMCTPLEARMRTRFLLFFGCTVWHSIPLTVGVACYLFIATLELKGWCMYVAKLHQSTNKIELIITCGCQHPQKHTNMQLFCGCSENACPDGNGFPTWDKSSTPAADAGTYRIQDAQK